MSVTSSAVSADPVTPSRTETLSAEQRKAADEHFRNGNRLYTQQKWAEAKAAFLAAWTISHTFDVAANLAHSEYQLGQYRDAAEHYAFAMRGTPLIGKEEPREVVRRRFEEAKKKIGALSIRVSMPGAMVLVDGKEVGRAPIEHEVFVDPGARTIEAKLVGYDDAKQTIEAGAGGAQVVTLALNASAAKVAPSASASVAPPPPASGSVAQPPPVVPRTTGPRTGLLITGGATAGAALITGVVFTVLANGKASESREQAHGLITTTGPETCAHPLDACQQILGVLQDWTTFRNGAFWSFVGASAVGAATVVYALATKRTPKVGVRAAPVMTTSGGAVVVGGPW